MKARLQSYRSVSNHCIMDLWVLHLSSLLAVKVISGWLSYPFDKTLIVLRTFLISVWWGVCVSYRRFAASGLVSVISLRICGFVSWETILPHQNVSPRALIAIGLFLGISSGQSWKMAYLYSYMFIHSHTLTYTANSRLSWCSSLGLLYFFFLYP